MAERTFFGDVVSRDAWEPIQQQLADALRMEIHTFGPDGADLLPPSNLSRFRLVLEGSPSFRNTIPESRQALLRCAGERADIVLADTVSGRLRFSVPILFEGRLIAAVTGGGVVAEPMPPARAREIAERFGVDGEQLTAAAAELPVASRATCEAAGRLISSLLNQLTTALELRQQADMRARRLAILADVSHTVTESLDLLRVLDAVVQAVPRVMPAKAAAVALLDDDGHALRIRAGYGLSEEFMQVRFVPGKGLLGHVVVTGEVINAPDMLAEPRNAYAEHDRRAGLRALVAVPLREGDRLIGVVAAFHDQPHSFTGGDQQVLEALANYAATAVRNARLYARVTQAYRELGVATRRLHDVQERLFHSDRLAMLGRLAGDTAHEMKNTLGGIIGAASTVRDQLEQLSDDDIRELVAAIAEEGWRLRDTIEAVRGYSKPGHYGGGAHSLAETIADAVRLLRFDHALMDLPFETTCPADLQFVGDRDRVKQVLINLLRNAVEALREVTNREPRIEVSGEAAGEMVRIRVSDNGVGIPAERIERIWEPFYTTKGVAGTGIGLDTVRQIVRAQGGEVEVTSEPGVGTTFTILLPRVREDEDEA